MNATTFAPERSSKMRRMLNRVPEVTMYFWLIKVLCTTVGETFSDNLTTSWAGGDSASDAALNSAANYFPTLLLFAGVIAVIAFGRFGAKLNAVLMFWLAYIMTRPLGASTGDLLSQKDADGLGLGTSTTSYIFRGAILTAVAYLAIRKPDVTPPEQLYADEILHPHLPHPHMPHPHIPHPHLPHGHREEPAPQEG